MTPELLLSVFGPLGTVVAGYVATRQRQLRREIEELRSFRVAALHYIGSLVYLMASAGLTPPKPPEELGLDLSKVNDD
ncbi:hypothetical protein GCM10012275_28160 [Longimycelium tulufanense]|uniref:Uncharacterized protein n=1 Tax=Longimycelium tulufanense TaxID=907463 RepID=A0A8J3FVZ6_9PSEU|nr:hypothetical protein GCM10012275_28160 [Longimycelium tulufanense]